MIFGLTTKKILAIFIVAMLGGSYVIAAHNASNDRWTDTSTGQKITVPENTTISDNTTTPDNTTTTTIHTTKAVVLTTGYLVRLNYVMAPIGPNDTQPAPSDEQIIDTWDKATDGNPQTNPDISNQNEPLPISDPNGIIEGSSYASTTGDTSTSYIVQTGKIRFRGPEPPWGGININKPYTPTILSDGSQVNPSAAYVRTTGQLQTTTEPSIADHWKALWHFGTIADITYTINTKWTIMDTDTGAQYSYNTDGEGTIPAPSEYQHSTMKAMFLDTAPFPVIEGHHYTASITAKITLNIEGQKEIIRMDPTTISFDATGAIA